MPRVKKSYPLPFLSLTSGEKGTLTLHPFEPFKMFRLVLENKNAESFLVEQIFVNGERQLALAHGLSGRVFHEGQSEIDLMIDACSPGGTIDIAVQNVAIDRQNVSGRIYGWVLDSVSDENSPETKRAPLIITENPDEDDISFDDIFGTSRK